MDNAAAIKSEDVTVTNNATTTAATTAAATTTATETTEEETTAAETTTAATEAAAATRACKNMQVDPSFQLLLEGVSNPSEEGCMLGELNGRERVPQMGERVEDKEEEGKKEDVENEDVEGEDGEKEVYVEYGKIEGEGGEMEGVVRRDGRGEKVVEFCEKMRRIEQEIEATKKSTRENKIKRDGVKKESVENGRVEGRKAEIKEVKKGMTKDLQGFWSCRGEEVGVSGVRSPIEEGREGRREMEKKERMGKEEREGCEDGRASIESGTTRKLTHLFQNKPACVPEETTGLEKERVEGVGRMEGVERGVAKSLVDKFMKADDDRTTTSATNADVVKSDSDTSLVAQGSTKELIQKWKSNHRQQEQTPKFTDVRKILEAGKASESGVFENCPEARGDVVREVDARLHDDVIPPNTTKSTLLLWSQMSSAKKDEASDNPPNLSNGTHNNNSLHNTNNTLNQTTTAHNLTTARVS